MNRTAILAAIGAVAIAGGTAVAATRPADRPVPLIAASASAQADETTTTTELDEPTTTSSTATEPESTTTTSTTEATRPAPPTTASPPAVRPLALRCAGGGEAENGTKNGDGGDRAWVYCEIKGVDDRAGGIKLTRDGETIARTDDMTVTSYEDLDVRPGATYSYQAHTFTADGRLLQSSDAIRATAGGAAHDGPLVLRCAGSGDATSGEKTSTGVHCEWKGVPERAAYVKLTRDGVPINRSDDAGGGSYGDREVWPDERYTYQVHAYAADDTLLASSDAVTVTPGGGGEGS